MKIIPFIFFTLFFLSAHASENLRSIHNMTCIRECQGNKVYLKTENLKITSEGMKIIDEVFGEIPIIELYSDQKGIYTRLELLEERSSVVYPIVWCHTCNDWRLIDYSGRCTKCHNFP